MEKVIMKKYFFLSGKNKQKVASAYVPETCPRLTHELIPLLEDKKEFPYQFTLKKIVVGKDGIIVTDEVSDLEEIWLDYQPNNLAWPLMSLKLKTVIEDNLTDNDNVDWISCKVICNEEVRKYYILRFIQLPDVLDEKETTFVEGTDLIIRPCFSLKKIDKHNIFPKPKSDGLWQITSGFYVSDLLQKKIKKERISGVEFNQARVK